MRTIPYNFAIASVGRAVCALISVLLIAVLTRYLGPAAYGYYSAVMAYIFIAIIVADLGLQLLLVREISQHSESEAAIASKIFTLRLLIAFIIAVFSVILVWFLPYQHIIKTGVTLVSAFIVFSSLSQVLIGLFQKHLRIYLISIADTIARIVQLGLIVFWAVTNTLTLPLVFIIVVGVQVLHFLMVFYFARRIIAISFNIDIKYWKSVLSSSLPIAASLLFTMLYFKIDTIFLSLMRSPDEVGIYAVAYKILEAVIFIPALYAGLVMPKLSEYAKGAADYFISTFNKAFDVISRLAFPALVFLFLASGPAVKLIGGDAFADSAYLLKILSLAVFLIFYGNLGGRALIALDLQKKGMWVYFAGAIINIAANWVFIPKYGALAASWTTVATEAFVTIAMFIIIKNAADVKFLTPLFFKSLLAAGITALIMLPFSGSLYLSIAAVLWYLPLLFVLGGVSAEEIRALVRIPNVKAEP